MVVLFGEGMKGSNFFSGVARGGKGDCKDSDRGVNPPACLLHENESLSRYLVEETGLGEVVNSMFRA